LYLSVNSINVNSIQTHTHTHTMNTLELGYKDLAVCNTPSIVLYIQL